MIGIDVNIGEVMWSHMYKIWDYMQWGLYFMHILTALLHEFEQAMKVDVKLAKQVDMKLHVMDKALHNILSVQDPFVDEDKNKISYECLSVMEDEIHQLREEMEE